MFQNHSFYVSVKRCSQFLKTNWPLDIFGFGILLHTETGFIGVWYISFVQYVTITTVIDVLKCVLTAYYQSKQLTHFIRWNVIIVNNQSIAIKLTKTLNIISLFKACTLIFYKYLCKQPINHNQMDTKYTQNNAVIFKQQVRLIANSILQ